MHGQATYTIDLSFKLNAHINILLYLIIMQCSKEIIECFCYASPVVYIGIDEQDTDNDKFI